MQYLTDRQARIIEGALEEYQDRAIDNIVKWSQKDEIELNKEKSCFKRHIQNLIDRIKRLVNPAQLNLLWITPKDGSPGQKHLIVNADLLLEGYTNLEIEELSKEKGIYRIEFVITRDHFVFSHGDDWQHGSVVYGELINENRD